MLRRIAAGTFIVSLVTLVGCGGGSGDPVGVTQTPSGTVELDELQTQIFTPRCATSGCHVGGSAPFGLDMSDGLTFGNTVNVASSEVPAFDIVEPGNAADSYLYMKVIDDPRILGDRMPAFQAPLSGQELQLIETWINDGAIP